MKARHSPEPWEIGPDFMIVAANGDYICRMDASEGRKHHENGRLLVARVNACAGMQDPAAEIKRLQSLAEDHPKFSKIVVAQQASIRELREALRGVYEIVESEIGYRTDSESQLERAYAQTMIKARQTLEQAA